MSASDLRQTQTQSNVPLQPYPKNATMQQIHEIELKLSLKRAQSLANAGEHGDRRDSGMYTAAARGLFFEFWRAARVSAGVEVRPFPDLVPARSTLAPGQACVNPVNPRRSPAGSHNPKLDPPATPSPVLPLFFWGYLMGASRGEQVTA